MVGRGIRRGYHLHAGVDRLGGRLGGRLGLHLCGVRGLRTLFAERFGLLLLLNARSRRLDGWVRLGIDRRHERGGELLLRDERVKLGLLRGPSFERVDAQQTPDKIDEGDPVVHLWIAVSVVSLARSLTHTDTHTLSLSPA